MLKKSIFHEELFSVFDVACGISEAIDYVSPELNNHHQRVAYISYSIAKQMGIPEDEIADIVLAATLHDIGIFSLQERKRVVDSQFDDDVFNQHQVLGYKLLKDFEPYSNAALLIRRHHTHYVESSDKVPVGAYIIHLADRLTALFNNNVEVLRQVPAIIEAIDDNHWVFHPDTLTALHHLAKMEYFWIEAFTIPHRNVLQGRLHFPRMTMDLETLRSLAIVISKIVDFRSRFTATHSCGVAAVASILTELSGFSQRESKLMEVAGFFHDLGKLAISNDILEKNGPLDANELNEIRKHSYYTYSILSKIDGFEQIAMWASYHHERLDGNGYPFHIKDEDFTKLSRIMAVADILTAITENRPYRLGMSGEKALEVLSDMASKGSIDKNTVDIVRDNYALINDVRRKAQQEELNEYNEFLKKR